MAAFRLLDLPMELVIAVSAQVDEQTLFDFKLACKRTFYACEPFFINANFGDLSFNFTTHSLKVLRHIADEPRFHPHLKLLRFKAFVVDPDTILRKSPEWQTYLRHKYSLQCPYGESKGEGMVPLVQGHLLIEALRSLATLPRIPKIVYQSTGTLDSIGINHLLADLKIDHTDLVPTVAEDLHPSMLLDALSISKYPLASLKLGKDFCSEEDAIPCRIFDFWVHNGTSALTCWSTLTSLHLVLKRPDAGWVARSTEGVRKLFHAAHNLKTLKLFLEGESDADVSTDHSMELLGPSIASQVLSTVHLVGFRGHAVDFSDFVVGHKESLRNLKLQLATIPKGFCWKTVLRVIKQELNLDKLKLVDLRVNNDTGYDTLQPYRGHHGQPVVFRAIRTGIESLINDAIYEDLGP